MNRSWTPFLPALGALAIGFGPAAAGPSGGADEIGPGAGRAPVEVRAVAGQSAAAPGGEIRLAVVLDLGGGWHVNAAEPLEPWLIPTSVRLDEPAGIAILEVVFPETHEIQLPFSEAPMAVYEGRVPIGVRARVPSGETVTDPVRVSGTVTYQACDDAVCLAPVDAPFAITLPLVSDRAEITRVLGGPFGGIDFSTSSEAATEVFPPAVEAAPPADGAKGWIERSLASHFANPLLALGLVIAAGLLSAATPCVYPMIPITARILMGRGGQSAAAGRIHAFTYFAGIIVIYGVLGLLASATGGGFNQLLRYPVVLLGFAILFALLGLSMFGFFEIQIPSSIATRVDRSTSSRSGLFGTLLMGVGAGLVVSPCVGPVVIFVLTEIAQQIAAAKAAGDGALSTGGQLAYGGFLMAGFGAGLGVPFLVVGLFSARTMARPGRWMAAVRVALGAVILYFAYDYAHKGLATAGVDRAFANAILTGVVLTFLAVIWGVFRPRIEDGSPHAGWNRVRHAVTILMLIVGVFYLWTGLTRSGLVGGERFVVGTATNGSGRTDGGAIESTNGLTWHRDFDAARKAAEETGLPIFVDFYAHWCANCKVFTKDAAKEGPLRDALEGVVRAKIYDTDDVFGAFRDDPRYPELKVGLPFFLILSSDGEPLWKGTDYRAQETFIRELSRARSLEGRSRTPTS